MGTVIICLRDNVTITMLCMLLLEVVCHKRFPHPLLSRPHHGTHTEIVDVLLASVVYTPSY